MNLTGKHIVVALSGGVDSSVAAALLKEQGYNVTGVMMKIWDGSCSEEKTHHGCYGPGEAQDITDAQKVAETLKIPFYTIDLSKEYRKAILDYFCEEYLTGRTPNPCTRCNYQVKFGVLIEKVKQMGIKFDLYASGHYARVDYDTEKQRYFLKKAIDHKKDQTYFLALLNQNQLSHLVLPLGHLTKTEVRKLASNYNLSVSAKPDSQNFISGKYVSLIENKGKAGNIVDKQGDVIGQHIGIQYYTIGQRHSLNLTSPKPLYVIGIDPATNVITAAERDELLEYEFTMSNLNWIAIPYLHQPTRFSVKIRSSSNEAAALVSPWNDKVRVHLDSPQLSITPGQTAVFYQNDVVIGGGIIDQII
jgi:tRNA-uridine 2-sulfurtransferase